MMTNDREYRISICPTPDEHRQIDDEIFEVIRIAKRMLNDLLSCYISHIVIEANGTVHCEWPDHDKAKIEKVQNFLDAAVVSILGRHGIHEVGPKSTQPVAELHEERETNP